jgi:hypothetical protein
MACRIWVFHPSPCALSHCGWYQVKSIRPNDVDFMQYPVFFILFQIYHTRSRIAILIVSLYHEGPYYILSIMSLYVLLFYFHYSYLHYLIKIVKFGFLVQRGIIGKAYTSASCLMLQQDLFGVNFHGLLFILGMHYRHNHWYSFPIRISTDLGLTYFLYHHLQWRILRWIFLLLSVFSRDPPFNYFYHSQLN